MVTGWVELGNVPYGFSLQCSVELGCVRYGSSLLFTSSMELGCVRIRSEGHHLRVIQQDVESCRWFLTALSRCLCVTALGRYFPLLDHAYCGQFMCRAQVVSDTVSKHSSSVIARSGHFVCFSHVVSDTGFTCTRWTEVRILTDSCRLLHVTAPCR